MSASAVAKRFSAVIIIWSKRSLRENHRPNHRFLQTNYSIWKPRTTGAHHMTECTRMRVSATADVTALTSWCCVDQRGFLHCCTIAGVRCVLGRCRCASSGSVATPATMTTASANVHASGPQRLCTEHKHDVRPSTFRVRRLTLPRATSTVNHWNIR